MKSNRVETFGVEASKAYKTIADYRWDETFTCTKCSGIDYFEGKYPYSRRCKKCKKDHSPTAGTIFHGVRFPLHIALFIAQKSVATNERIKSEKLTELILYRYKLTIRHKTVWAFLMKLYNAMVLPVYAFDQPPTIITFSQGNKIIVGVTGLSDSKIRHSGWITDIDDKTKIDEFIGDYKSKKMLPKLYNATFRKQIERKNGRKMWSTETTLKQIEQHYVYNDYQAKDFAFEIYSAIAGVSSNHYQGYLNFYFLKANGYGYDELMNTLVKRI